MPVSDVVLKDVVETSLNLLNPVPGRLELLRIPGVQGRITNLSSPLANVVVAARLDESNADRTIAEVYDLFTGQNKAFGWVTGPSTTPTDLGERLERKGLAKIDEMAALVLTDLETSVHANPEVEIREATHNELQTAIPVLARAYGLPEDLTQLFADAYTQNQDKVRARYYLAYLSGEPVSWAFLVYIPDQPIALLGGAGTLPEHRGKGIYTSLVARRLADARADGIEAAVLQAVQSSSAPICRKIGFRDIGAMDFYGWLPEGSDRH